MKTAKEVKLQKLSQAYAKRINQFIALHVTLDEIKNENWYQIAHNEIVSVSRSLSVPVNLMCGIVAVLSPLVPWDRNISWAIDVVKFCQGQDSNPYQGMYTNLGKALWLYWQWQESGTISDATIESELSTKTGNFFHNLLYPESSQKFTIDVWMFRVALGLWHDATNVFFQTPLKTGLKLGKIHRDAIAIAYDKVYNDLQLSKHNVASWQLQAILWLKIKDDKIASKWFTDFNEVSRFRSPEGKAV